MTVVGDPGIQQWMANDDAFHLSFPSGGTGSVVDDDIGIRPSDWDITSNLTEPDADSAFWFSQALLQAYLLVNVESPRVSLLRKFRDSTTFLINRYDANESLSVFAPLATASTQFDSEAESEDPINPKLSDLVLEIKALSGLPAGDAARLISLGRRQFHNLAQGSKTRPDTERRIRLVAEHLKKMEQLLQGDRERIRSSILAPIGSDSTSYFEVAECGNMDALREKFDELVERINSRKVRYIRRAVPRPASAKTRAERRKRLLEDLAG